MKNKKEPLKDIYPFEFYTHLNDEYLDIINSGFFEKDITIKRKK